MKRFRLSRRTFLGGASTVLSLPLLECMLPTKAFAAAPPPVRLMAMYVPNGKVMSAWTPAATGASYALTPILESLLPVKSKLLVLSGLANVPGATANFDTGHQAPTTSSHQHLAT